MMIGTIAKVQIGADGWTAEVTFTGMGVAGSSAAYDLAAQSAPRMRFEVTSPGFDEAGQPYLATRDVIATRVVREPYPNQGTLDQRVVNGDLVTVLAE